MATSRIGVWVAAMAAVALVPGAAGARAGAGAAPGAVLGNLTGKGYVNPGRRVLANGMTLNPGDQVVLRSGKLSMRMPDGTTVKLSGPAEFMIESLRDAGGRTVLQALMGRVFVRSRQGSGNEVRVNTPSATLAVRGSGAGMDVTADMSLFWCTDGIVYVVAGGDQVWLGAGYQTEVRRGEQAQPPVPMTENTQRLNEDLNLVGATAPSAETGLGKAAASLQAVDDLVASSPDTPDEVALAQTMLSILFQAYEEEDRGTIDAVLASSFSTQDGSGTGDQREKVLEACSYDFSHLQNIRFFRLQGQTPTVANDHQVLARERWVMNAVLAGGARFQQAGETVFTLGADTSGAWRVLHWEGDPPFGRYQLLQETMPITAPAVITPPAANAPDILVRRGELGADASSLTNADVTIAAAGVLIQGQNVNVAIQGSEVRLELADPATSSLTFEVNGALVHATSMTVKTKGELVATDVWFEVGGVLVRAETLRIVNGTVELTGVTCVDELGNPVTLVQATIQPGSEGQGPVVTGVTETGQAVTIGGGQVIYEAPPGAPLPAGRGERISEGKGFRFAGEVVTDGPADLYLDGGSLLAVGVLDLGVVAFDQVTQAPPADGPAPYQRQIAVSEDLANHVLVVQTETGRYAKILVRPGTTPTLLIFDWVYNPEDSTSLSRGRRWPTRARVAFNARVYSRAASGQTVLQDGVNNVVEVRLESARSLSNGASIEAHLAPRFSTDRASDSNNGQLDRLGIRYFQPNQFEVALGDLSGQFTPYTLNRNLLGLMAWRNVPMGPAGTARITATLGPHWRPGGGMTVDGWVTGLRLATEELRDPGAIFEDLVVGVNLVRAMRGRRSRNTFRSSTVISADASARFRGGLALNAEYAHSNAEVGSREREGTALLLRAAYRLGPFRLIYDRERIDGGFYTVSGTAASDQVRTNVWLRCRPNEWLSANVNFLRIKDNVSGSKAYTTRMSLPRYGLSVSPFYPVLRGGFLRNLTLDFLFRRNVRASDDLPRTVDRLYRTLSVSLIQRMGDVYLTLGRDSERDEDRNAAGVSRRGRAIDLSLRWRPRSSFLSFPVSPIVGLRRGRDSYAGPRGTVSSRVTSRRFGVEVGDPSAMAVELGYEFLDNERTDFGGYNRRVLNLDLTRVLDRQTGRTAGLSYRLLTNRQESGARRYTEGQLTGSIRQEF